LQKHYTLSALGGDVLRMETGLPAKEGFHIVLNYTYRFKQSITYFDGWKVESISFKDQIFITLIKVKKSYTGIHLAQLVTAYPQE